MRKALSLTSQRTASPGECHTLHRRKTNAKGRHFLCFTVNLGPSAFPKTEVSAFQNSSLLSNKALPSTILRHPVGEERTPSSRLRIAILEILCPPSPKYTNLIYRMLLFTGAVNNTNCLLGLKCYS